MLNVTIVWPDLHLCKCMCFTGHLTVKERLIVTGIVIAVEVYIPAIIIPPSTMWLSRTIL